MRRVGRDSGVAPTRRIVSRYLAAASVEDDCLVPR
jgi:hypothetical protein